MDVWINDLIGQYHLIFNNDRDMRLVCMMDTDFIHCYGLDEIELSVYYIMKEAGAASNLNWEIKIIEDTFYFFPVIVETSFKHAIDEMTEKYPVCKENKSLYCNTDKLKPLYKVCQGEFLVNKEIRSCNIVVDMIFNLNRSDRKKEDLDNFCALFCCYNVNFLHAFLMKVNAYIKEKKISANMNLKLLNEVTLFMDKIFSFRKYIMGNSSEDVAYLNSLKETSLLIANLLRRRGVNDDFAMAHHWKMPLQYNTKMELTFPTTDRGWNYKAGLGVDDSCQQLFRKIARKCTRGKIKFESGEDDLQIVKAFFDNKL